MYPRRSEFAPGFGPIYRLIEVRAIVALEFFPVRPPARHRRHSAAFRARYAVVLTLLVFLRVMLTVSRFSHDVLAQGLRKA